MKLLDRMQDRAELTLESGEQPKKKQKFAESSGLASVPRVPVKKEKGEIPSVSALPAAALEEAAKSAVGSPAGSLSIDVTGTNSNPLLVVEMRSGKGDLLVEQKKEKLTETGTAAPQLQSSGSKEGVKRSGSGAQSAKKKSEKPRKVAASKRGSTPKPGVGTSKAFAAASDVVTVTAVGSSDQADAELTAYLDNLSEDDTNLADTMQDPDPFAAESKRSEAGKVQRQDAALARELADARTKEKEAAQAKDKEAAQAKEKEDEASRARELAAARKAQEDAKILKDEEAARKAQEEAEAERKAQEEAEAEAARAQKKKSAMAPKGQQEATRLQEPQTQQDIERAALTAGKRVSPSETKRLDQAARKRAQAVPAVRSGAVSMPMERVLALPATALKPRKAPKRSQTVIIETDDLLLSHEELRRRREAGESSRKRQLKSSERKKPAERIILTAATAATKKFDSEASSRSFPLFQPVYNRKKGEILTFCSLFAAGLVEAENLDAPADEVRDEGVSAEGQVPPRRSPQEDNIPGEFRDFLKPLLEEMQAARKAERALVGENQGLILIAERLASDHKVAILEKESALREREAGHAAEVARLRGEHANALREAERRHAARLREVEAERDYYRGQAAAFQAEATALRRMPAGAMGQAASSSGRADTSLPPPPEVPVVPLTSVDRAIGRIHRRAIVITRHNLEALAEVNRLQEEASSIGRTQDRREPRL